MNPQLWKEVMNCPTRTPRTRTKKTRMVFSIGAGRGGRRSVSGKRNRVLVYILFNSSDIAGNVPGLSVDVREFCLSKDCLKVFMRKYFDGDSRYIPNDWCCSNCD